MKGLNLIGQKKSPKRLASSLSMKHQAVITISRKHDSILEDLSGDESEYAIKNPSVSYEDNVSHNTATLKRISCTFPNVLRLWRAFALSYNTHEDDEDFDVTFKFFNSTYLCTNTLTGHATKCTRRRCCNKQRSSCFFVDRLQSILYGDTPLIEVYCGSFLPCQWV